MKSSDKIAAAGQKKVRLSSYLKPYAFWAILSPILMVGEVYIDLLLPDLMSVIVDDGVIGGNLDVITSVGLRMLLFVALGGLMGALAAVAASFAAQGFGNDLRRDAYNKVMSLSVEQTDRFTTGSLVTRLTNDISATQDLVSQIVRMFVRAPMTFIGAIIMAVRISPKFGIVIAASMPIQILVIALVLRKATPMYSEVQKKLDSVNSVVQENVTGARVVKAFTSEEKEIKRFDSANSDLTRTTYRVQKLVAVISPVMMIVMNLAVVVIIMIGGQEVIGGGELSAGNVMAATTYITQTLMSLMMVSMMFQSLTRASASARRIREVLQEKPVIEGGKATEGGEVGTVSFRNVSFSYPDASGQPVLSNVSLDIKRGENVAILGATGSGKSSLVNLIPRFYDDTSGQILIDGKDIKEYDVSALRSKVAFVLQKTELFSGTIADNIRFGKEDASDEEVEQAAKIAQAHDFITSFADGYNTIIGEKGSSLSGGQKQRIAIARAIVRKPEILIFDDSTSALDLGTEARLVKALRESMKDTTVITIAQRIATVIRCDRIAVIDNGRLAGCGTHEEMMRGCPEYREIYYSQMKKGGNENG